VIFLLALFLVGDSGIGSVVVGKYETYETCVQAGFQAQESYSKHRGFSFSLIPNLRVVCTGVPKALNP